MPCDTINREAAEQRKRDAQLAALEESLKNMTASVQLMGDTVTIEGWEERGGWCDECAISRLRQSEDFEVRQILANAIPQHQHVHFGHTHIH